MVNLQPKISIVLPTYNGEKWLAESIQSVLKQTEHNWELIIVNDCSTDSTLSIAQSFAEKDKRVRIISNTVNKKLPASLNVGFAVASANYLTWTSDDNMYKPDALQSMSKYLNSHPQTDLVSFDMDYITEDGNKIKTHIEHCWERTAPCLIVRPNIGAAFMYRRSIMERIGEYDVNTFCAEDYDYWCRIALAGNVEYVDHNIYLYRDERAGSLSATKRPQVRQKTRYIQQKYMNQFFEKFNFSSLDRAKSYFLTKTQTPLRYIPAKILFWIQKRLVRITSTFIFFDRNLKKNFKKHFRVQLSFSKKKFS